MNIKSVILTILSLTIVTGCTSLPKIDSSTVSVDKKVEKLKNTDCCISLNEIRPEKLKDSQSFSMEENNSKLKFNNEGSYYKLFKIPPSDSKVFYNLKSYLIDIPGVEFPYAFVPDVYILDENYKAVRKSTFNLFYYRKHFLFYPDPSFEIYIRLEKERQDKEKFILIVSAPVPYNQELAFVRGQYNSSYTTVIGGNANVINETKTYKDIQFTSSPSGVIELKKSSSPWPESRHIKF